MITFGIVEGALKKFRRTPWRFQQTFHTPLKRLDEFVSAIDQASGGFQCAQMIIDEIVFEPTNLLSLSNLAGARAQLGHGFVIDASEGDDARALLKAALSDWVDFCFTPHPKPFVIYADHDEFATFLANSRSNLNRVVTLLQKSRFTSVDYTLEF